MAYKGSRNDRPWHQQRVELRRECGDEDSDKSRKTVAPVARMQREAAVYHKMRCKESWEIISS